MPKPGPRTTYRYSDAFKATAVRLSQLPGVAVRDVAESLYIHPFMLSRWRRLAREEQIVTKGVDVDPAVAAELKALRKVKKDYERLKLEHELLKKAIAFTPAREATSRAVPDHDPSNGYEAVASEFMARRGQSGIGAATVRAWARSLQPGATILDLGCGHGVPISAALLDDGFDVYGIDASPTLTSLFRSRFPRARVACEAVEDSDFFGRKFDGIIAVGLMFLLPAEVQDRLIRRVAQALGSGGRFLFTSPEEACAWQDVLTGQQSLSMGAQAYRDLLSDSGLALVGQFLDEGQNHYYDSCKR